MKKFNGRKLLALMMTLIMLLSLMPAAFADGEAEAAPAVQDGETPAEPTPAPVEPTPEPKYLAKIGDVKYETLDDAVKAAQSGDVIELLDDCTSGGMDLTKSITIKGNYSITFAGKGIALRGAALTFDGCTVVMTGIGATGNAELGWMTIALGSGSSLNLRGASLTRRQRRCEQRSRRLLHRQQHHQRRRLFPDHQELPAGRHRVGRRQR